ncbi:unnamed protein product [Scytosiphon promiscuus]
MQDENSRPPESRPSRIVARPARFSQNGESGAAAGHGNTQTNIGRGGLSREVVEFGGPSAAGATSTIDSSDSRLPLARIAAHQDDGVPSSEVTSSMGSPVSGCSTSQPPSADQEESDNQQRVRQGGGLGHLQGQELLDAVDGLLEDDGDEEGCGSGDEDKEEDFSLGLPVPASTLARRRSSPGEAAAGGNVGEKCGKPTGDVRGVGDGGAGAGIGKGKLPARPASGVQCVGVSSPTNAKSRSRPPSRPKLQVSAEKAITNKLPYESMAVQLLQKLCTRRGIRRMSTTSDRDMMASKLKASDAALERSSPDYDEIRGIAKRAAGAAVAAAAAAIDVSGNGGSKVPAGAVLAARQVLRSLPRRPMSTMKYDGREYKNSDIYAIIDAEDAVGTSAGSGTASAGAVVPASAGNRKSLHCTHRLLACIIIHRQAIIQGRSKASRCELDAGEVGAAAGSWQLVHAAFTDKSRKLPRVSDDPFAKDTNPNKLCQPNITAKKLKDQFADLRRKFNPCYARKTGSESGTHHPWKDFCYGDVDVFLMGETVAQFEELLQVVDQLLPEGVQREDDGTGGGGSTDVGGCGDEPQTVTGPARRAAAKRQGVEMLAESRKKHKAARKTARAKEAEQTANNCVTNALSAMSGMFSPAPGAGSKWRDITDQADSESAQLDLSLKQGQAYL